MFQLQHSLAFRLVQYFFNSPATSATWHAPTDDVANTVAENCRPDGREDRQLVICNAGLVGIDERVGFHFAGVQEAASGNS